MVAIDRLRALEALSWTLHDRHPDLGFHVADKAPPAHPPRLMLGSLSRLASTPPSTTTEKSTVMVCYADADLGTGFFGAKGHSLLAAFEPAFVLGVVAGHDRSHPEVLAKVTSAFGPRLHHYGRQQAVEDGLAVDFDLQHLAMKGLSFDVALDSTVDELWSAFYERLPEALSRSWTAEPYQKGLVVTRSATDASWLSYASTEADEILLHADDPDLPRDEREHIAEAWLLDGSEVQAVASSSPLSLALPGNLDVIYLAAHLTVPRFEELVARVSRLWQDRSHFVVVDCLGAVGRLDGAVSVPDFGEEQG